MPILTQPGHNYARKLRDFIREFFMIEAAEADLRRSLRAASIDLKDTTEYRALIAEGTALTRQFLQDAIRDHVPDDLDFITNFVVLLTTSLAERTTDEGTSGSNLIRQADMLSDMVIAHFNIC